MKKSYRKKIYKMEHGHFTVLSWIQNRCLRCGRFLGRTTKYCPKCFIEERRRQGTDKYHRNRDKMNLRRCLLDRGWLDTQNYSQVKVGTILFVGSGSNPSSWARFNAG
jgi:hypothetical protein